MIQMLLPSPFPVSSRSSILVAYAFTAFAQTYACSIEHYRRASACAQPSRGISHVFWLRLEQSQPAPQRLRVMGYTCSSTGFEPSRYTDGHFAAVHKKTSGQTSRPRRLDSSDLTSAVMGQYMRHWSRQVSISSLSG